MKFFAALVTAALALALSAVSAPAADWITAPSYYTHDVQTGERVALHTPIGPFYYFARSDYLQSGYRHYRSTLDLGNSSDNLHIVEEWGRPVRPYDEWRFPYRPYSVPYDQWGPPYGGLGTAGFGLYPYGGFPGPYPYDGGSGFGFGGHRHRQPPANFAQPWLDGHYPQYDFRDRSPYWRPYVAPPQP